MAAHNNAISIISPPFFVGDFVLACKTKKTIHKLSFIGSEPLKVIMENCPAIRVLEALSYRNKKSAYYSTKHIVE